jgi:hypothetical protein
MKDKLNISSALTKVGEYGRRVRPYTFIIFLVFAAMLYGFVVLRINSLSNIQPSEDAIQQQVKTAKLLTVDSKVVQQLQALQDNSVRVNSLFDDARNNPF